MSNFLNAHVTIRGKRPVLWNHLSPEIVAGLHKPPKGKAGNNPNEWRYSVLATPDGQLFFQPTYLFGCLREAARYSPKGLGSLQSDLAATLEVTDDVILVDRWLPGFPNGHPLDLKALAAPPTDPRAPVYLDVRMARNAKTRGANVRYRVAASPGWGCAFHIRWDAGLIDRAQMDAILRDAAEKVGLGDGRKLGFGRFDLLDWVVTAER